MTIRRERHGTTTHGNVRKGRFRIDKRHGALRATLRGLPIRRAADQLRRGRKDSPGSIRGFRVRAPARGTWAPSAGQNVPLNLEFSHYRKIVRTAADL